MRTTIRGPFLAAAAAVAFGCSPKAVAVRAAAPVLDQGLAAFYEEPDPQLAREAMPAHLKLLEALLENHPSNQTLLRLASQGFGGYAFLFLEDSEPERARGLYLRGRAHGLSALARNPSLRGLERAPLPQAEAALREARRGDVPGLFWAAYGWGGWINLSKDSPDAVADLPKVAAAMQRVRELDPRFYFGGADLFLGSYYALRPKMLGGDPVKAKAHFEAALAVSRGRFLVAKVLYAQYYAVAVQDADLFQRLLDEVLAAEPDLPQARLANAVAKIKAKNLKGRTDDLF